MARGRKRQIRYYDSRGGYYTTYEGKTYCLATGPKDEPIGPTFEAARAKYREILTMGNLTTQSDRNLVGTILESFLQWIAANKKPATLANYVQACKSFAALYGKVTVADLKRNHLTSWLASKTTWGPNFKSVACTVVIAALNWAVNEDLISHNPLAGYKGRPRPRSRGADTVIAPDEHQQLIAAAPAPLRLFLRALLRHTGATLLLKEKVPLAFVAQALGHKDTKMIEHHYGHLVNETEAIRAELDRAKGQR
jgi:site-specific recombinase XerD